MIDTEMTLSEGADRHPPAGPVSAAARALSVARWLAAAKWLAAAAGTLGLLVFIGWACDIASLRGVLPGAVQMKPNTAVALMLAAVSLYFRAGPSSVRSQRTALMSACLVAAIGAVTLCEYVFGWRLGIDEWLFRDGDVAFNSIRGRMSPYSAVGFIAIGSALAAMPRANLRWPAMSGAIVTAAIGAASIVGYSWNASELTTDQVLPPVAVNTALAFLLLSVGALLVYRTKVSPTAAAEAVKRGGVEKKVLAAFIAALLLLYLAGGITYRMGVSFANSAQWVTGTQQVRAALGELRASISDAESAQRNHQLTGLPQDQREYTRLVSEVERHVAQLHRLLAADEAQLARLSEVERALTVPTQTAEIRSTIRRMDDAEAGLLTARAAELGRNRSFTLYALMAILAIATAALILLFRSITRDIRERARIAGALHQAQREAQRASRAKSEFLAAMSHEIRTPMNGVIGMVDVLLHSSLSTPQVEMATLIRESADSLLTIIDSILDFSKIEAGHLQIESIPLSVAAVVENICSLLNPLAARKETTLTVFTDPALPGTVLGDAGRLRQVLINLAGNAIKFSSGLSRPGRVSVRARMAERHPERLVVEFQINDNGIGMNEETLAKVFASFTQADSSTTRKYGGTGLGLSISRQLATLMGGEILVASAADQGSTFTLRLPFTSAPAATGSERVPELKGVTCVVIGGQKGMADDLAVYLGADGASVLRPADLAAHDAAHAENPAPAPSVRVWVVDAGEDLPSSAELEAAARLLPDRALGVVLVVGGRRSISPVPGAGLIMLDGNALNRQVLAKAVIAAAGRRAAEAQILSDGPTLLTVLAPVPAPQRRRILVAEDNEINQLVIQHQLQLLGYAADVADNGREALRRWEGGDYALLLTDLHMPELDGYELTAAIRQGDAGRPRIPIVALTANALKDELERCRAAGMDDYLSKPVAVADLGAMLERWLTAGVQGHVPSEASALPESALARDG